MKKIIVIIDGLGDLPYKELKNRTPLGAAETPNLDFLAKNGKTGLLYPIKGIAPESGEAQFVLLGQPLNKYPGRGVIEALGSNIKINQKNTYLRCNFAKVKGNKIIARAKIPSKKIIKEINKIDKDIRLIPTVGYRAILIIKNSPPNISNTNPGYIKHKNYSEAVKSSNIVKKCKGDKKTVEKINKFLDKFKKIKKDHTLLLRGASNKLPRMPKLKNWELIGDMPIEIGLAKLLSMKIKSRNNKIKYMINTKNNIYVQIKGPDTYSHLGDLKGKIKAIEKIDRQLKPLTKLENTLICITADHSTPCKLKRHSKHPVPILIYGKEKDNVKKFSEKACKNGSINIEGKDLMKILK